MPEKVLSVGGYEAFRRIATWGNDGPDGEIVLDRWLLSGWSCLKRGVCRQEAGPLSCGRVTWMVARLGMLRPRDISHHMEFRKMGVVFRTLTPIEGLYWIGLKQSDGNHEGLPRIRLRVDVQQCHLG